VKTDTTEIPIARLNATGVRIVASRARAALRRMVRRVLVRKVKARHLVIARTEHNTFKTTRWGWEVSFR
jgi:hypothetical protein